MRSLNQIATLTSMGPDPKEGDELDLEYRLSNGVYESHKSIGMKKSYGGGFITRFEPRFPEYFAESSYLHIDRDGKAIDRLSLDGTAAAVPELRKCALQKKAEAAAEAREKARWSHIPKDPFAKTEK